MKRGGGRLTRAGGEGLPTMEGGKNFSAKEGLVYGWGRKGRGKKKDERTGTRKSPPLNIPMESVLSQEDEFLQHEPLVQAVS